MSSTFRLRASPKAEACVQSCSTYLAALLMQGEAQRHGRLQVELCSAPAALSCCKASARQPVTLCPMCQSSPPSKRSWKPMLFPDIWDPRVTQGPGNASAAAGMEGSSTVRNKQISSLLCIPTTQPNPCLLPVTPVARRNTLSQE